MKFGATDYYEITVRGLLMYGNTEIRCPRCQAFLNLTVSGNLSRRNSIEITCDLGHSTPPPPLVNPVRLLKQVAGLR
jgi:LSD1 subclass zinc finger protein